MIERTPIPEPVKRDMDQVKDQFGGHAQHYAEMRAKAAETAGDDDDADHWRAVGEKLDEEAGE